MKTGIDKKQAQDLERNRDKVLIKNKKIAQ